MPSVNEMDTVITAPELPDVSIGVAGGGDFELFFNANVEPEKEMAYIVSLFCRYLLIICIAVTLNMKHCSIFLLFFKVDDGNRLHARFQHQDNIPIQ